MAEAHPPSNRRVPWPSWLTGALAAATAFAFPASPEAALAAGVPSLVLVHLLSPARERDSGFLLLVLGLGVLVTARSFLPGLGMVAGGLYLLARARWPPALSPRGAGRAWASSTLYELATALAAVALLVVLLQRGTGTWPAMVAVESCSMEPNIRVGDLVLVVGPGRSSVATLGGDLVSAATGDPLVTPGGGVGKASFASASGCVADQPDHSGCARRGGAVSGDVIVFYPNGNPACTPIIHRAVAWIPDNASFAGRNFSRGGFITQGDNNGPRTGEDPLRASDQVAGGGSPLCPNTRPVRPEWLVGVAKFRIPWLGYVRLLFGSPPEHCTAGL